MKFLLLTVLGAGIAGALLLYFFQGRLLYHPSRTLHTDPGSQGLPFEDVTIETADAVRLHAWFVPHSTPVGTVLFLHGNGGNIADRPLTIAVLHGLGLAVLILDYRGYGASEGSPSERGTYADAEAAWKYLIVTRGVPPHDVIIYGRSLGGAVALELAAHNRPRAVIIESTFTSLAAIAREIYPFLPGALVRYKYQSIDFIKRLNAPVLVAHSEDDEMIPFAHGEALYRNAPDPKQFFRLRGKHNEAFVSAGEKYYATLGAFIRAAAPIDPEKVP